MMINQKLILQEQQPQISIKYPMNFVKESDDDEKERCLKWMNEWCIYLDT